MHTYKEHVCLLDQIQLSYFQSFRSNFRICPPLYLIHAFSNYNEYRRLIVPTMFLPLSNLYLTITFGPGRRAQLVTCLTIYACLTADPGVASSIPARSHTFMEINHEIISTVFLPSADSFKKGCCQLQAKYVNELLLKVDV